MKSRFPIQTLTILLCVLALGVSQAWSFARGYVCECGDSIVITQTAHCGDGQHGHHHHDSEEGEPHEGEHQPVQSDVSSRPTDGSSPVSAPLAALLPECLVRWSSALNATVKTDCHTARAESPPAGVRVARTVVLLI